MLVVWCNECEVYCSEEEIGYYCPMNGHETWRGYRKLVKRRGYVCPGDRVFFSVSDYQEHIQKECGGASIYGCA